MHNRVNLDRFRGADPCGSAEVIAVRHRRANAMVESRIGESLCKEGDRLRCGGGGGQRMNQHRRQRSLLAGWVAAESGGMGCDGGTWAPQMTTSPRRPTRFGDDDRAELVPIPAGKIKIADPADPAKMQEIAVGPFYMSARPR